MQLKQQRGPSSAPPGTGIQPSFVGGGEAILELDAGQQPVRQVGRRRLEQSYLVSARCLRARW
jgi:hypothetical protein